MEHKEFVERIVDEVFAEIAFNAKNSGKRVEYNGLQLINREVIIKYLHRLLAIDKQLAPFKIKDIESSVYQELTIHTSAGIRNIGIVDGLTVLTRYTTIIQGWREYVLLTIRQDVILLKRLTAWMKFSICRQFVKPMQTIFCRQCYMP